MDEIRHSGVVTAINADNLIVTIISQSACSGCHARGGCLASDMKEKEIEVSRPAGNYTVGQRVTVVLQESMGVRALAYGYLFPFVLLIVTLVVVLGITGSELWGGVAAVAILVPYYAGLYFFRDRMKKSFSFTIDEHQ